MGLETNFKITGHDFLLKAENGTLLPDAPFALVQWELGYDPALHPLTEWTGNPVMVSWTGWYQKEYPNIGQGIFGSNGTAVNIKAPLYMFIDFGNTATPNPAMYGQVWMGQVTDILTLDGGYHIIDLNSSNIRSVVGTDVGNILMSQNFNTWTPQAVPEPSYAVGAVVLFAVAVLHRFKSKKKQEAAAQ
jgi:hypothetical protein